MKHFKDWLVENTLGGLLDNTKKLKTDRHGNATTIPTSALKVTLRPHLEPSAMEVLNGKGRGDLPGAMGKLLVLADVEGGNQYRAAIDFDNVMFLKKPDLYSISIRDPKVHHTYHIEKIDIYHHNAKVFCSCLDFEKSFKQHNHNDGSLHGAPGVAHKPFTNRPSPNQGRVAGMCKHLIALSNYLKDKGLTVG